jgi:hypothetical protein
MTTLALNTIREFAMGDRIAFDLSTAAKIFQGAAVGLNLATGYVRPLVAGDLFVGFAEARMDNTLGQAGDARVIVVAEGRVQLAINGLAITDVGKAVYAADDDTFTLTPTGNSYVGKLTRYVSSGVGMVTFEKCCGGILTALTDNSGGTATTTLAAITDVPTKNAIASLAAQVNAITQMLK